MTAQEAMDYIVTGTQNGLDKTNELGDNLSYKVIINNVQKVWNKNVQML